MITPTVPYLTTQPTTDQGSRGRAGRRFAALVRAETTILVRNKTAMFAALVLPVLLGVALMGTSVDRSTMGVMLTSSMVGTGILLVVYYTMVTSLVGRREQLVLKRLRAGEGTPLEILLAPAVPLWMLLLIQSTVAIVVATLLFDSQVQHGWALPLAVLGGASAWTTLAVWSSSWTRTVESAQLTTLPLIVIALAFSGISVPLTLLPDVGQHIAHLLPMTPVVDLINLAYLGAGANGDPVENVGEALLAAAGMVLPLVGWTVFGLWAGVRNFRWDARS